MTRRRKSWSIGWKVLAIFVVLLVYAAWPGRSTFTVSPETTYVTGPLDERGNVDYVTALNERLSKGITPENNANVLIWKALGPHPEGGTMPSEYFQWLGIDPPPEEGEYLVSRSDYLKLHASAAGGEQHRKLMDRLKDTRGTWLTKDDPELAEWLQRKERPLALAIEATRRKDYFHPLFPVPVEDWPTGLWARSSPNVQQCRDLAAAIVCRAMLRLGEGKTEEAWQDLLACHRLGRLVAHGGTAIEWLVGLAIDRRAGDADLVFLGRSQSDARKSLAYMNDLKSLPPMPSLADKLDLAERFIQLDLLLLNVREGIFVFGWQEGWQCRPPQKAEFSARLFTQRVNYDPALRRVNRFHDLLVEAVRVTPRAARERKLDEIEREADAAWEQFSAVSRLGRMFMSAAGRGDTIGNMFMRDLVRSYRKQQSAADRLQQAHRNLQLAFALAAFHADTGHYPAKLEELAPKYLDKIPNDLFSDKPLIYKPDGKGYLFYSVGPNGLDDEGQTYDDDPRGDDIAVRMPVPPPREKK